MAACPEIGSGIIVVSRQCDDGGGDGGNHPAVRLRHLVRRARQGRRTGWSGHFFQIKPVGTGSVGDRGGTNEQPLLCIDGREKSGSAPELEINYRRTSDGNFTTLQTHDFNSLRGQWLEVEVIATYNFSGCLRIRIKKLDGTSVISLERTLDLWRSTIAFNRPKWGIYRSLLSKSTLDNAEDTVDFADFTIQEITNP